MPRIRFSTLIVGSILCGSAAAHEILSSSADQQQLAVTIYNQKMALVKDSRKVNLDAGENALAWRDVSAQIQPATALLRNLSHAHDFYLIEQNFDFDLLTPEKLLEKQVGHTISVIRTHPTTGVDSSEQATVLSANNGVVLQFADRIEVSPPGRLAFQAVPENLRDRPTLVVKLHSGESGSQNLELTYLTGGLSWNADYVVQLSANEDRLDLNGWVTLTNQSGISYRDAKLQLVAGDVNRVQDKLFEAATYAVRAAAPSTAPRMSEEGLLDFHLYTLDRPTTIAQNQTKQVALLSAAALPVRKEYVLRGADYYYRSSYGELGQKMKVGVFIEFNNKAPLGVPMPRGVMRVYKKDSAGGMQFVGEDRIDHTPKNEKVKLKLGDAFDVTATKKQTAFQKAGESGRWSQINEAAFRIVLKNAKNTAVTVEVVEPIPGDWEILSENHPHSKETANTAIWKIEVPAEGSATLDYRVRVRL